VTGRDHQSDETPPVDPDTESDPGLDDETGSEWASEGGAVEEGPATETSDPDDGPTR